ncbi:MAG: GAF domain-containing protein [Oscillatoriales cyanobacterium]|nr:MAG: GAF domain-containing protein [Oscillatoriales cyanobacterium]
MRSFAKEQCWKLTRLLPARFSRGYRLQYIAALLMLGGTIAASIGGYITYQSVRRLIIKNLEQNALLEVRNRSNKIDRWIETRKAEIEILANTPPVRSMNWLVAQPYLKSEVNRLPEFEHFALIEPDGSYFTTKVGRAAANVSDRRHFQKAMAGEVYVSDPTISRTLKQQIIPISAPVRSKVGDPTSRTIEKPIGVMNGVIKIQRLAQVVGKLEYGAGTYAFVLNSQGVPIVHPDARLIGNTDFPASSLLDSKDANLVSIVREMVYQKTGISLTKINDAKVYVVYLPLEQAEWSIALVIPQENLDKQLYPLNILAAVTTALLVIAIMAAVVALKLFVKDRLRTHTEALLHRLTSRTRASLDVDRILQTTVEELGSILDLDRTIFGWYDPRKDRLEFCSEYYREGLSSRLGVFGAESGPSGDLAARLHRGESVTLRKVTDIDTLVSQESQHLRLKNSQYAAVPVLTQTNRLGYLFACSQSPFGTPDEVEVLEAIADSLAIAISQSQRQGQIQEQLKLLEEVLAKLRRTEAHLVQREKITILGKLTAGIAREINNPINFIYGHLIHINDYLQDLFRIIQIYSKKYPESVREIEEEKEKIDLDFVSQDLPKIINTLKIGSGRIRDNILALQKFSTPDDSDKTYVNLQEGIDDILVLFASRLDNKISLVKQYNNIPLVLCYGGQINQVFASILSNAIEAMNTSDNQEQIIIVKTEVVEYPEGRFIAVSIANNGPSIPPEIQRRIFDPFFTTKSVTEFTGLGLSLGNKIIAEVHGGRLWVESPFPFPFESQNAGGVDFVVELPIL